MLRIVFLLLLVLGLLWWFGKARGRPSSARPPEPGVARLRPAPAPRPWCAARIAACTCHQADAIAGDEPSGAAPAALFCSEAHRRLGPVEEPRA